MKKSKQVIVEELCSDEQVDEVNGICYTLPVGKPIAQFDFSNSFLPILNMPAEHPNTEPAKIAEQPKLVDNRTLQKQFNGATPAIDGESFKITRGFTFRVSTIRKLNELKAFHPDENAYLSTIIDNALCHYYDYIFKEKGHQK